MEQFLLMPQAAQDIVLIKLRLKGRLDTAALRASVGVLLRRHALLRTRFAFIDGMLMRAVVETGETALAAFDLTAEGPQAADISDPAWTTFDLAGQPLFRSRLVQLGSDDHVLSLVWHRLIAEPDSAGLLVRELSAIYAAMLADLPLPAPPQNLDLNVQWAHGMERPTDWLDRFAGTPPLRFKGGPSRQSRSPGGHWCFGFRIPEQTAIGLTSLAERMRADTATVVLAAFGVLLGAEAEQDDFLISVPVVDRKVAVGTVPVRFDLSGDPDFTHLVERVRSDLMVVGVHGEAELAEELDLPLFQIVFDAVSKDDRRYGSGQWSDGLQASVLRMQEREGELDLELALKADEHGLDCTFRYRTDLFDRAAIGRLAKRLTVLLATVVADPNRRLSQLSGEDVEPEVAVYEPFRSQLPRPRIAVAVYGVDRSVSYAELDARADRLAGHLRRFGVGSETVVGVALGPGLGMAVALLAIWKVGGAYLPLDPDRPGDPPAADASVVIGTVASAAAFTRTLSTVVFLDDEDQFGEFDGEPVTISPMRCTRR